MKLYRYRADLRRVVDGDTIDVDVDLGFRIWRSNVRVRLLGVDTPEARTRDPEEKAAGKAATVAVRDLLLGAEDLVIESEELDSFGRALSRVFALVEGEWIDVSEWLLRNGLARPYGE